MRDLGKPGFCERAGGSLISDGARDALAIHLFFSISVLFWTIEVIVDMAVAMLKFKDSPLLSGRCRGLGSVTAQQTHMGQIKYVSSLSIS